MSGTVTSPASPSLPRAGTARAWILAARPATLTAAVVPVLVGTACAWALGAWRAGPALAALVGAMLLQIGANFANDVFDYEKGADTEERLGPTRAVQAGLLPPEAVRRAMGLVFLLALGVGAYLTVASGWIIVAIGLSSILCAIAYTGGPYPLGYHGLGDVFVMLFFGFVAVCGSAFVQLDTVPLLAWVAAVPVGAIATAVLVVNNVRDCETDVRAGKRTLPVRFGRAMGLAEYRALLVVAYATPVVAAALRLAAPTVLLPVLTAPAAIALDRRVRTDTGRALNATLVRTAKLLFVFGVLFALGIGAGRWI